MPTVGQLLIDSALPEDMRGRHLTLDKKGMNDLLAEVARKHPDQYREVSHALSQLGWQAAQETGGYSFGVEHLQKSKAASRLQQGLQRQLQRVADDDTLSDKQRETQIIKLTGALMQPQQTAVYDEALKSGNPLALQVQSGARGSKGALNTLLGSDLLYTDHNGNTIPLPVLRSYSEGLTPAEYIAGSFGARKGVLDVKMGVANAGYFAKRLTQGTHRLVVTDLDKADVTPDIGLPVAADDKDNEGALLARDTGGYKRNTPLTPKIISDLQQRGHANILVRSPVVSHSPGGGVYSRDVGVREHGTLPGRGEYPGITASQSISEPVTQGGLCLAKGTLVLMADQTEKPIESVVPGDRVMGADVKGNAFPVVVVASYRNGLRACYDTFFRWPWSHGKEPLTLRSTLDHKILAITMKSMCKDEVYNNVPRVLPLGTAAKEFKAILPETWRWEFKHHDNAALFAGLILGDGCYTASVNGVYFSCADPSLIDDIKDYLLTLDLQLTKLKYHDGIYYRFKRATGDVISQNKITGRMLAGSRNPAKQIIERLGMTHKYAHEKVIPESLMHGDDSTVAAVLTGLFVTDGSIYIGDKTGIKKAHLNYSSTSLKMCQQVRNLLAFRFGIYGTAIRSQLGKRKRRFYSFTVTATRSVQRFFDLFPLLGIKAGRVRAWRDIHKPGMNVEYARCSRLYQIYAGEQETFDIEVDHPDHLFVLANGLIVGNSSKHSGGVSGAATAIGGYDYLNSLVEVPDHAKGGATHAETDGMVGRIEKSPAGGHDVWINNQKHYVHPDVLPAVESGDQVEAGDVISSGIPNPAKAVEHKGIGEGRRYFVKAFRDAMNSAGIKNHRRNIELLSRGLINHVRMTDEYQNWVPDDVVPYHEIANNWAPREGSETLRPSLAVNRYLEKPVLHHTIGTRLKPRMLKELTDFGVSEVTVHRDPPPFQPEMIRAMYSTANDPEWMTRMLGSGLKGGLLKATARGSSSDEQGTSFVPSLAKAVDFGRDQKAKTRKPEHGWRVDGFDTTQPSPAIKQGTLFDGKNAPGSASGLGSQPPAMKPITSAPLKPESTTPQSAATPQPQPQAATSQPRFFGDYQPSENNMLSSTLLAAAPSMGPAAPFAAMAGVDWNAFGSLTRGANPGEIAPGTAATPPTPPTPSTPPATVSPAPPAKQPVTLSEWNRATSDNSAQVESGNTSNWQAARDIGGQAALQAGGTGAFNGLTALARRGYRAAIPAIRNAVPSLGKLLPDVVRTAPAASTPAGLLGRMAGKAPGFLAQQSLLDNAIGGIRAGYNGSNGSLNPVQWAKGLPQGEDNISNELMQPTQGHPLSMELPAHAMAMGKDLAQISNAQGGQATSWRDGIVNQLSENAADGQDGYTAPHVFGDNEQTAADSGNIATQKLHQQGAGGFRYHVATDGRQQLLHAATGSAVPNSYDDFVKTVSPANQAQVARDLYSQMPDKFVAVFSDPQWLAYQANGMQPPPEVQAAQQQRIQQVVNQYGLWQAASPVQTAGTR